MLPFSIAVKTAEYKVAVHVAPDGPYIILTDGLRPMCMDATQARAAAYDLNMAAARLERLNANTKPETV